MKRTEDNPEQKAWIALWLTRSGEALLAIVVAFLIFLYFPIIREEVRYAVSNHDGALGTVSLTPCESGGTGVIVPVDPDYSIVIPKIGANVRVVRDVDPSDPSIYRKALSEGIAQATGTKAPGEPGNTFLFAHSSDDFFTRGQYNTVFYLLDKLASGDRFTIASRGRLYDYHVFDKKTVSADRVEYLNAQSVENTVTLMTCWPPGTDAERLLVFGVLDGVR